MINKFFGFCCCYNTDEKYYKRQFLIVLGAFGLGNHECIKLIVSDPAARTSLVTIGYQHSPNPEIVFLAINRFSKSTKYSKNIISGLVFFSGFVAKKKTEKRQYPYRL